MGVRRDKVQVDVEIGGKKAGKTLGELQKDSRQLYRELRQLAPGTEEFKRKLEELRSSRSRIQAINQDLRGVNRTMDGMKGTLKKVGAAMVASFAVSKITSLVSSIGELGISLEAIQNKAKTVFGSALPEVEKFARDSASSLGLTKSEAIDLATSTGDLLIPMGFLRDEAAKMSTDLVGLSGALSEWSNGEKDAAEVSDILTKAMLGERDGLKSLGISISETDITTRLHAKSQDKLTGALLQQAKAVATQELIFERSKDAQSSFVRNQDTLQKKVSKFGAEFRSIGEAIASSFLPALGAVANVGLGFLNWVQGVVEVPLSEKIEGQRIELNALTQSVINANENEEVRLQLLNELDTEYPDFLKNLDKETVTNEQLRDRLKEVNKEYRNKVVVLAQEEALQEAQEESANQIKRQVDAMKNINKTIAVWEGRLGITIDKNKSLNEQVEEMAMRLKSADLQTNASISSAAGLEDALLDLTLNYHELSDAQSEYDESTKEVAAEQELYNKILGDTGIKADELHEKLGEGAAPAAKTFQERIKGASFDQEAFNKKVEKASRNLEDLRIALIDDPFEKRESQLRLQAKRKIETLVGTPEQVREQSNLINDALTQALFDLEDSRIATQEELDNERVERAEARLQEKLAQLEFDEEVEIVHLEERFSRLLDSEKEKEEALFELKQNALQERLQLLESAGLQESGIAQRIQLEMLKNQTDFNKRQLDQVSKTNNLKKKVELEGFQYASDIAQLGIDLLSTTEDSRKKHSELIKAFTISQIFVDLAREIAGYMANPANTGTMGISGGIQSGVATIRASLAVAKVANQKFEGGGVFNSPVMQRTFALGGIAKGPRHHNKGIAMVDSQTGLKVGEMEGGEPYMILSRNTYANNREVVDQLLYSTLYRGGAPIYESGGVFGGQAPGDDSGEVGKMGELLMAMIIEMQGFRSDLGNFSRDLRAYVVYDDIAEAEEAIVELENESSLG